MNFNFNKELFVRNNGIKWDVLEMVIDKQLFVSTKDLMDELHELINIKNLDSVNINGKNKDTCNKCISTYIENNKVFSITNESKFNTEFKTKIISIIQRKINNCKVKLNGFDVNSINFNNVRFRYSKDSPWVLDGVNLTIPAGARFGFIGSTGSGKSTLLDLLMGLLKPTEGELLVDGQLINGRTLRAWQQTIAHVPQSIYLTDTTLAENIAFGVLPEDIDLKRVYEAAKQAQIAAYIESQSMGYNTLVGERGVRLSGGQRQRIGIARALYKQANILVFDEATSALDNATERSVMNAIEGLDHNLTILIIAHRLTTIKNCDTIVELENGRVLE